MGVMLVQVNSAASLIQVTHDEFRVAHIRTKSNTHPRLGEVVDASKGENEMESFVLRTWVLQIPVEGKSILCQGSCFRQNEFVFKRCQVWKSTCGKSWATP